MPNDTFQKAEMIVRDLVDQKRAAERDLQLVRVDNEHVSPASLQQMFA